MKPQWFVALTVVLFVLCLPAASALDVEYNEGYALSKTVERSDLIVVGRVTEIEFIWRDNIESKHTTDITLTKRLKREAKQIIDKNSQLCGSTTTRPSMTIMERGREKCVSNR